MLSIRTQNYITYSGKKIKTWIESMPVWWIVKNVIRTTFWIIKISKGILKILQINIYKIRHVIITCVVKSIRPRHRHAIKIYKICQNWKCNILGTVGDNLVIQKVDHVTFFISRRSVVLDIRYFNSCTKKRNTIFLNYSASWNHLQQF